MLTLTVNRDIDSSNSYQAIKQRRSRTVYTLETFINEAQKIHSSNYDYRDITVEDINNGVNSKIPIICNCCGNKWITSIKVHINSKSKCPTCARFWRWTLESFISRAKQIHGQQYDYQFVTSEHINGKNSYIPILCKRCNKIWSPTIASHINNKSCCPTCPKINKWSLQKFIVKGNQVHGNKYNYSLITNEMITDAYSYVPVICNKCNYQWLITPNNHINLQCGCPHCKLSKGELICESVLKDIGINYVTQVTITSLPGRKYDFSFVYNGSNFLLEFDGMQHFQYVEYFHQNIVRFSDKQNIDYIKTKKALDEGYKLIRISYLQFNNIKHHITTALNINKELYLSDPEIYKYITSQLSPTKYLTLNIIK